MELQINININIEDVNELTLLLKISTSQKCALCYKKEIQFCNFLNMLRIYDLKIAQIL